MAAGRLSTCLVLLPLVSVLTFLVLTLSSVGGEPGVDRSGIGSSSSNSPGNGHLPSTAEDVVDPNHEDVGSLLISTVYSTVTPTPSSPTNGQQLIPDIEMKKLKAAAKGAGLSDAKADRVLRAVRALDLKYHQVVDLKKVMINPATSADYAERLRRALEDAVVDAHSKVTTPTSGDDGDGDDDSAKVKRNAPLQPNLTKTSSFMASSDLDSPQGRSVVVTPVVVDSVLPPPHPLPPTLSSLLSKAHASIPPLSGPHLFFATPLTAPALPEDLDNLWILASHVLPRKEAFELVQLTYSLQLSRAALFDLQHEFAGGRMTPDAAQKLLSQLRAKVAATPTPSDGTTPTNSDLSKPLDNATLKRLQTVAELSGLDKNTSQRLVRAVVNSGLERNQVSEIGDVIQGSGASVEDLHKLMDHLEETDLRPYRKRGLDGIKDANGADLPQGVVEEGFHSTPAAATGADWIYSNPQDDVAAPTDSNAKQ